MSVSTSIGLPVKKAKGTERIPMKEPKRKDTSTFTVVIVALALMLLGSGAAGGDYALTWGYVGGGGGQSTGGGYGLLGTVGCFGQDDLQMTNADLRFSLEPQTNGRIRIGYSTLRGDAPRSIALHVNLGSATVQSPADVLTREPVFNAFLDYIYSNPAGYVLGDGHPLAHPSGPGVPNFGTGLSQFALNMACFDPTGNQAPGPASSTNLITLQLHGSGTTTVTLGPDTTRGGSYAQQGQTVNLPMQVQVNVTPP